MSWKHLKTLAIVILLMMDVIFVFNVAERKRAVAYYDDALIDSAITVLKESGLYVERSFLEEKKQNASVYVGKISADAFTPIMAAMAEQGYTAEEEPGGLSFAGEKGRFFFGNDFLFTYYETGFTEAPSKLFSGRYYVVLTAEDEQTKVARSMVETFLDSYALRAVSKTKYAYDFDFLNFYYSGTVFESDTNDALFAVFNDLVACDVAFLFEDVCDRLLHVGSGNVNRFVFCAVCVSDTSQHVCNNV